MVRFDAIFGELTILIILHAVAVLASFGCTGHILVYAPRDILIRWILVILHVVAVLASFGCTGHILVYAPRDTLICRLATTRII
ncbi:hypothetical protein C9446_03485 [Providencia heimbachae]|nr:hypothetical protein C9446_03485 [Providencia heimbachae]